MSAMTDTGGTVYLAISGNVTSFQMSNVTISINQSANSTIMSFTVTGASGTTGFSNITIQKSAVLYGTTPTIYIDNQPAQNQGYVQDRNNYYVWYSTHFSTHRVTMQFAVPITLSAKSFEPLLAIGIIVPEIVLIYTVIVVRNLRRKPDMT